MMHILLLRNFSYSFVNILLKHFSKTVFIVMVPLCLISMLTRHYNCVVYRIRCTSYSGYKILDGRTVSLYRHVCTNYFGSSTRNSSGTSVSLPETRFLEGRHKPVISVVISRRENVDGFRSILEI